VTQSAWRLFIIAATAAVVFGTAGWILAIFGGKKTKGGLQVAEEADGVVAKAAENGLKATENGLKAAGNGVRTTAEKIEEEVRGAVAAGASDFTEARAASTDAPLPRSTPTMTGR
jgi:hypothetical protein